MKVNIYLELDKMSKRNKLTNQSKLFIYTNKSDQIKYTRLVLSAVVSLSVLHLKRSDKHVNV